MICAHLFPAMSWFGPPAFPVDRLRTMKLLDPLSPIPYQLPVVVFESRRLPLPAVKMPDPPLPPPPPPPVWAPGRPVRVGCVPPHFPAPPPGPRETPPLTLSATVHASTRHPGGVTIPTAEVCTTQCRIVDPVPVISPYPAAELSTWR